MAPTKKSVTREQIEKDPLWMYSAFELRQMSGRKLRKLLYGPDGRQPLPGRIEAFERKLKEFEQS